MSNNAVLVRCTLASNHSLRNAALETIFYIGAMRVENRPVQPRTQLSKTQLEAYIRHASLDSRNVFFTLHVQKQMKARRISMACVLSTLQHGRLRRTPEPNLMKGTLECRMEYFSAERDVAVIVALSDDDPSLVLVTAMFT
jgi:replication-associated recombination protein RarA